MNNNYTPLSFQKGCKCLSVEGKVGVFVPEMSEPDFYVLVDSNGWRGTV